MDELEEHRKNKEAALARDMKSNPDLAKAVESHPAGKRKSDDALTPTPRTGGPGKIINMTRRIR